MKESVFQETLEVKLKELFQENINDYIKTVSDWLAYIILTDNKKVVSHEDDPPWDYSGRLINLNDEYNLEDYTNLLDFVDNEYNGVSSPTFMSRIGLIHEDYFYDLERLTMEWMNKQLELVIKKLIAEDSKLLKEWIEGLNESSFDIRNPSKIVEELHFEDMLGDFLMLSSTDLQELVLYMDIKFLYKKGESQAEERIRIERTKMEKERKKEIKKREKAEDILDKIKKRYKLKYGEDLNVKIDKRLYENRILPILQDLEDRYGKNFLDGVEKLNYIYSVSNSVASLLENLSKDK